MKFVTNTVKNNYRSLIINLSKVKQCLIQVRISSLNPNNAEPSTAPKNDCRKVIHKTAQRLTLKLKKKKKKKTRKRNEGNNGQFRERDATKSFFKIVRPEANARTLTLTPGCVAFISQLSATGRSNRSGNSLSFRPTRFNSPK